MIKFFAINTILFFGILVGCSKNNAFIKSTNPNSGGGTAIEPGPTEIVPGPTSTETPTPIVTVTSTATATATATSTPTSTFTPSATATSTATATATSTSTATWTPSPTFTPTFVPSPTFTPTPSPTPTHGDDDDDDDDDDDCDFEDYEEHVPAGCVGHQMTVGHDHEVVADAQEFADHITFTATKKNGGAGGSRWYDAKITLGLISNVLLPAVINIQHGGNAGNGQKLYLIFDNTVICSYRSSAGNKYTNPICKLGGVIDPTKSDGFATGIGSYQSDNTKVANFKIAQVTVNGASGGGVVTKVIFDLVFY